MMTIAQRIEAFEAVRDIPYAFPLTWEEAEDRNCSCTGKAFKLGETLRRSGFDVRDRLCTFRWQNMPLPADISRLAPVLGETHHYLEVFVPEKGDWVSLDSTWDAPLSQNGFHLSVWDGLTSTGIGVPYDDILSVEEGRAILAPQKQDKSLFLRDLEKNYTFLSQFNTWLKEIRKG